MRHIKNISPTGIKVNISVATTDGQVITVELNHGESILVNDTGAASKSVIIQKRKGNIDIIDEAPEGMIPYRKYISTTEVVTENPIVKLTSPTIAHVECDVEIKTEPAVISSIEPIKNKGGRPKGSFKKKGPGRPKGTKKKKSKKTVEERVDETLKTSVPPDFTIADKEWIDKIDGSKIKPKDIL